MFNDTYATARFTTAGEIEIPIVLPFMMRDPKPKPFGPVEVRDIIAMQEATSDDEYDRLRQKVIEQMRQPISRENQAGAGATTSLRYVECIMCNSVRTTNEPVIEGASQDQDTGNYLEWGCDKCKEYPPEPPKAALRATHSLASGKDAQSPQNDHEAVIEALRHQGYRTE